MDVLTDHGLLGTLLSLLPGFLTSAIIGALVLREERNTLDRIIQALIYTFLAHVLWSSISWLFPVDVKIDLLGLTVCAVALGVAFTWMINTGLVHHCFRRLGLTRAASRPNEWYDAFYDKEEYIYSAFERRATHAWVAATLPGTPGQRAYLT